MLLDKKMYKHSESREFKQNFVRHLITPSTFTVPIAYFVGQKDGSAFISEIKFRQVKIREVSVKEEVTPPSLMIDCFSESARTS